MKRVLALLVLVATVSGCATIKNFFNNPKKENIQPPTPLTQITPTVTVQKLWSEHPTSGAQESGARMDPVYDDGKLYTAGVGGEVAALDGGTGRTVWKRHLGEGHGWFFHRGHNSLRWTGGPSVSGGLVIVGSVEGVVQALDAGTGEDRWHAQVSSEVIAPAAIGGGVVVVRSNDGRLYGLNASDGSRRWVYDRDSVPVLSLRGNAAPRIADGVVYAGEDDGKVVALRLTDGKTIWEQTISPGEGRTELERLQDVDGSVAVDNGVVYAAGYHGVVAALIAQSGRPLWTHKLSSYTGVAVAPTHVFVVDADSGVWGLDLRTGASDWKQSGLAYRWLGEASTMGDYVVVGDLDGYVHWLSAADGKFAARDRLSGDAIRSAPVVAGDTVYVEDVNGAIGAWRMVSK